VFLWIAARGMGKSFLMEHIANHFLQLEIVIH